MLNINCTDNVLFKLKRTREKDNNKKLKRYIKVPQSFKLPETKFYHRKTNILNIPEGHLNGLICKYYQEMKLKH